MEVIMKHLALGSFIVGSLTVATAAVAAPPSSKPLDLVPGGAIVATEHDEVKVKTPGGTVVEIELHRDGTLEEASGDAVDKGDVLVPGGGLLSLADVVGRLGKDGKAVTGEWSLEQEHAGGWVYELQTFEQGHELELHVRATDGVVLSQHAED
jgi:hypothetical protein